MASAATVSLRAASATDAPALARLFAASRRAPTPWLPALWTADQELAWMAGEVLPACRVTVAEDRDGAAVGFVARRAEWIDHLRLDPGRRRRGLGAALLAAAGAFYERQGFRAVAESDGSDNEGREPSVLFERRRPPDGTPTEEPR